MPLREVRTCSIEGCEKAHRARGWCGAHYRRWKVHGDPAHGGEVRGKFSTPEESFAARTEWRGGHLVWTGSLTDYGHGEIHIGELGRRVRAHRYAWERKNGPVPDGMVVDHMCHVPACVRVDHLRLASPQGNNWNRGGQNRNGSSGYRGVTRNGSGYLAHVMKDRKAHYGGTFRTPEEAAARAEEMRAELFGEFHGEKEWEL